MELSITFIYVNHKMTQIWLKINVLSLSLYLWLVVGSLFIAINYILQYHLAENAT